MWTWSLILEVIVKVLDGIQCYFREVPDFFGFFSFCFYVSISLVNCKLAEMSILLLYFLQVCFFLWLIKVYAVCFQKHI